MSWFALSWRTSLPNFVFQLSKTKVQKLDTEKSRFSLEPARITAVFEADHQTTGETGC